MMIILRSSSSDLIYAHIYIRTFSRVCSKKEDGCVIDTDLCYISMLHTMYSSGHTYTSGTHKTQTRPQAFILTYTYHYTNIYYTHIEKHTNACINKDTKPTNTDTRIYKYTKEDRYLYGNRK